MEYNLYICCMDATELRSVVVDAMQQNKYVIITYGGTARNVYPMSFRDSGAGLIFYAWDQNTPGVPVKKFKVGEISDAVVSTSDITYVPATPSEFSSGAE